MLLISPCTPMTVGTPARINGRTNGQSPLLHALKTARRVPASASRTARTSLAVQAAGCPIASTLSVDASGGK